jgi:hypothetical protein
MANKDIYVGTKGGQTTTAFPVVKGDHITLHNLGPAELKVTFTDTPLCTQTGQPAQNPLAVATGQASAKLKVCKGPKDGHYPYVNEIAGFAPEDPIVIIESAAYGGLGTLLRDPIVIIEAALVLAALVAGFLLGRRSGARKAQATSGGR